MASAKNASEPHWLDKIIEEQRKLNGDVVTRLIARAAQATEHFTEDELEEHSEKALRQLHD